MARVYKEFDEADDVYLASIIPDKGIPTGMFSVIEYVDGDSGKTVTLKHVVWNAPVKTFVGSMFVGMMEVLLDTLGDEDAQED